MSPELEKMMTDFAAGMTAMTTQITALSASVAKMEPISAANLLPKVEPHAAKLEAAAAEMEAAGIGGDPSNGHAVALRKMAGCMRAEAAQGRMPSTYHSFYAAAAVAPPVDNSAAIAAAVDAVVKPLAASLAAMGTQMADLKAAAFKESTAPVRKTLTPEINALLARSGLEAPAAGEKLALGKVDAALKDLPLDQRISVKAALSKNGLLD